MEYNIYYFLLSKAVNSHTDHFLFSIRTSVCPNNLLVDMPLKFKI
jgi:hypothetical protein